MLLAGLVVADEPAAWRELGFGVDGDTLRAGGVGIRLAGRRAGRGILGWHVDGLRSTVLPACPAVPGGGGDHPNGVIALDHVVAFTGDLDAAVCGLAADGLAPRRIREVPGGRARQAFYPLGTALLELVGPVEGAREPRFWGLTFVTPALDALAAALGDRLGPAREAVQPGRRIATVRREAGAAVPLAFMTPR